MKFQGFEIECDVDRTQNYRNKYNELCECRECDHFRRYFDLSYPMVSKLLMKFGINSINPISIIDSGFTTKENMREYCAYFSVKGRLPVDKIESSLGEVSLILRNWTIVNEAYANTGMEKPEVSNIFLKDVQGEFCEAVRCGREIEFNYKGKNYFESRHGEHKWYIYCKETKEIQYFVSAEELLLSTILEGDKMNDIWEEIRIDYVL